MNDERDGVSGVHASVGAEANADEDSEQDNGRSERIGVGGGDENVAKLQLAARWSELYAPVGGDSIEEALRRFKRAYTYLDSVTKLVDPDEQ